MVKGIGVDIVEISRIERAAKKFHKFVTRVFTAQEIGFCMRNNLKWARLAARFAAKEAVSKALGTGIGAVKWTDIEVISNHSGKPEIKLHGVAVTLADKKGITQLDISISHCLEYAIAFVIAY